MAGKYTKVPVWCDVDVGHDDCFALLLASYSPHSELLGVSTVHGNSSLANTTANTLSVLEAIGRRDVPVIAGFSKPWKREACSAGDIHGQSGLDGTSLLPKPSREALASPGDEFVDHIAATLMTQPPQTVWVVATGVLTNIHWLFAKHPPLIPHIKGLSIMGGAVGDHFTDAPLGKASGDENARFGNWTPYAEFNIAIDPEAAHEIFSNAELASKTTLITLDLTHQCLATKQVQDMLLQPTATDAPSRLWVRQMMNELLVFFEDTYRQVFGLPFPPLHDPLAVLAAIQPELFTDKRGPAFDVFVKTAGGQYDPEVDKFNEVGRTVVRETQRAGVRIPTTVDLDAFWQAIKSALDMAVSS